MYLEELTGSVPYIHSDNYVYIKNIIAHNVGYIIYNNKDLFNICLNNDAKFYMKPIIC